MIKVDGKELDSATLNSQFPAGSLEAKTLEQMAKSSAVYSYSTLDELKFEMKLRRSLVQASRDLANSSFAFRVFRKSKSNPDFWKRTEEGGFQLLSGVKPSDAIRDIYQHSNLYGTECSTAMMIVYYKAVLDVLPEELFNKLFSDIYLMNWQHIDSDFGLTTVNDPEDYLPGDAGYFKNPDVDPMTPEWQGENVFYLGDGKYYGHGIGITDADHIIAALNRNRVEGATRSAYKMDMARRPGFKNLYKKLTDFNARTQPPAASTFLPAVIYFDDWRGGRSDSPYIFQ